MHYVGIDAGGTKTAFTLFDEDLSRLDTEVLPTCHFMQVGYDGMERVLTEGLRTILGRNHVGEYGIGFGLAGYGEEATVRKRIGEICRRVTAGAPFELVNDGQSARAAALDLNDGIVLVSGTGSIAFGVRGGEEARCGGWGYQVGDEGSGWWIGKRLLAAFSRESDGRAPRGAVHDVLMERLALPEEYGIIGYVRDVLADDRTKVAGLARYAAEAASLGDAEALRIYEDAARELAEMAAVLVRRLFSDEVGEGSAAGPVRVTYVGGAFRAGELLLGPLRRALPAACELRMPAHEPDLGAVLLLRSRLREVR